MHAHKMLPLASYSNSYLHEVIDIVEISGSFLCVWIVLLSCLIQLMSIVVT